MDFTRVFIHGLEGSSRGAKGTFFRQRFPEMVIEDYTGDLEQRMAQLEEYLTGKDRLIVVGSSFGGLMAALFACRNPERVRRLVLLAPALEYGDFRLHDATPLAMPVTLYHGRQDDVVAPEPTRAIAMRLFSQLDYHLVNGDHTLNEFFPTLDWDRLLEMDLPQDSVSV